MKDWMKNWGGSAVVHDSVRYFEPNTNRLIDQEKKDRHNGKQT